MYNLGVPQARRNRKVLVVDDQEELRRLFALTLRRQYEVREACDVDQALAAIENDKPDALILDVMLPGTVNGFELCERIKRSSSLSDIHVIMVTARGQEQDIALGQAMGADAYFVKPFSPLALVNHLDHVLAPE